MTIIFLMIKIFITLCLSLCLIASCAQADVTAPSATLEGKKSDQGDISYPKLWAVKDPAIEKSVNDAILKEAAGWSCDAEEKTADTDFNAISEVRLLKPDTFSYTINFDYFCGGAYPDAHMETRNYDLTTGKLLTLEDLLNADLAGEKLAAFVTKDYVPAVEECEGAFEDRTWNFYLTEDAMVFLPEMPHVAQACVEEFKIPLSKLKPYLLPGTILNR